MDKEKLFKQFGNVKYYELNNTEPIAEYERLLYEYFKDGKNSGNYPNKSSVFPVFTHNNNFTKALKYRAEDGQQFYIFY